MPPTFLTHDAAVNYHQMLSIKYCQTLTGLLPQFSAVLDRNVASLFKLERWIDTEFFPSSLPECLRPTHFPRISLLLERTVTLCSTESEYLRQNAQHVWNCHYACHVCFGKTTVVTCIQLHQCINVADRSCYSTCSQSAKTI